MKRVMLLACLTVVALIGVVLFYEGPPASSNTVKIGVVLPFSGSMTEYGQNGMNGLTLALEILQKDPSLPRISLIYQDTGDNPQGTVAAVRRLIDVDHVQYIIGGLTSSGVLAAAPYAQQRGVLFFTPAASAPGIPEIGDMIFRNWPADDAMSRRYGDAAFRNGVRRVAILAVSNDYGNANADGFASAFEAAGGSVSVRRSFPQGTTDFRTLVAQLLSLKSSDRILVIAYPDEYRAFFQELAKSPIKSDSVLTSDTFYSPNLVGELGAQVEGVITVAAAKPGDGYQPRRAFIEAYQARFKAPDGSQRQPGLVSDTAFDALNLIVLAISKTNGSPKAVSHYLLQDLKHFQGAAGPTTFTLTGDVRGNLSVYQVKSGNFAQIWQ